ncbi:MAG: hypothetical protein Q8R82_18855 [Hyphomonadaceae bacterium]|nr:hypothetical protein [Hyphomonadaceae bacterium]
MKQAAALLLAIFCPLGALMHVLRAVMDWRARMDSILADPELVRDLRETPAGRITMESAVALGEHWINIIIAARTCEIAELSRTAGFSLAWKGWTPCRARSWRELMQRYRRLCASFAAIERAARRRAARIVRLSQPRDDHAVVRDDDQLHHDAVRQCAPEPRIRAPPWPHCSPKIRVALPCRPPAGTHPCATPLRLTRSLSQVF